MSVIALFITFSSTFVFQAGLISVLLKKFSPAIIISFAYLSLSIALHVVSLVGCLRDLSLTFSPLHFRRTVGTRNGGTFGPSTSQSSTSCIVQVGSLRTTSLPTSLLQRPRFTTSRTNGQCSSSVTRNTTETRSGYGKRFGISERIPAQYSRMRM